MIVPINARVGGGIKITERQFDGLLDWDNMENPCTCNGEQNESV